MKKKFFIFFILFFFNINIFCQKSYDLLLMGFINPYDGIGQISLSFYNCLKHLKIKLVCNRKNINVPDSTISLVESSIAFRKQRLEKVNAKVAIFTDLLWMNKFNLIPDKFIKFAYSMTEYTVVDQKWVKNLNKYFDGLIVPDEYFIGIYKNSGVKIPIFVLPMSIDFTDFFETPVKKEKNKPFVFGCSAGFWSRKNQELLMQAFHEEFGDNPDFQLVLHGRGGQNFDNVQNYLNSLNCSNIQVTKKVFDKYQYIKFLKSLDCYVLISKGEGFSITPREALSLGIPCILTNNTAHKTICDTHLVYPVPANIIEPAYCETIKSFIGNNFNCSIDDVKKALRAVYDNYDYYLGLAKGSKKWLNQYKPEILKGKYTSLIKPKNIIFGTVNKVTDSYLMTNSKKLYKKYKEFGY